MPDPREWITTILYYTSTEEIDSLNFITIIENLFNDQVNKRILKTQKQMHVTCTTFSIIMTSFFINACS